MTLMIEHNHSRRAFLKTGLAATLGTSAGWAQASPPARKLRIAGVGIGGMGNANLGSNPPRQPGHSPRRQDRLERRRLPGHQPPRGSRLHPHAPPTRLGTAGLTAKYG